jgi:hypothetical protein
MIPMFSSNYFYRTATVFSALGHDLLEWLVEISIVVVLATK